MLQSFLCAVLLLSSFHQDTKFFDEEKAAVERAGDAWAEALKQRDPEKIASLYADKFFLYATFTNAINTRERLLKYFETLSKKEGLQVEFNEENIRVFGGTGVNSGLYTFSFLENGTRKEVPARYTLVYTLTPSGWLIVDHHSSTLPQ